MRQKLMACLVVALLVTLGAQAQVEKSHEPNNPPDHSNEFQVGVAAPGQTQILEEFENGVPPSGWQVIDNESDGVVWKTNTAWGDPNKTNGAGESAACNSDTAGPGIEHDTELISPIYDFCNAYGSGLHVKLFYEHLLTDFFVIDVSTSYGAYWTNILMWTEDHLGEDVSLDLSGFEGHEAVSIRFRYFDPDSNDWNWDVQVDDFELTSQGVIVEGPGVPLCGGDGDGGGTPAVPATSRTGVIVLALLLVIGGSLFVVFRVRPQKNP